MRVFRGAIFGSALTFSLLTPACAFVLGVDDVSYQVLPIAPFTSATPVTPDASAPEVLFTTSDASAPEASPEAPEASPDAPTTPGTCTCNGTSCKPWTADTMGGPDRVTCNGGEPPRTCTNPDPILTGSCKLAGHDHLYFYYWYCCS